MVASLIHVLSETRLSFSLKRKFSCFGSKEPYLVNTMTDFQIILCTCADREQAERIAHRLVPRFPVEIGGVAELHAAFREESRTRGCVPEPRNRKFGIELELAACVNIFPACSRFTDGRAQSNRPPNP
jgi:hypothetical protein